MLVGFIVVLAICVFIVMAALFSRGRALGKSHSEELKTNKSLAIIVMMLILALLLSFVAAIVAMIGDIAHL